MLFDDMGVVGQGVVNFSGRKTLVYYNVDEKTGKVRASGVSRFGIDCDGDGKIDMTPGSSEWRVASSGEPLVFRVGDRYVSTKEVSDTGRIVLREHAASEYTALEWRALEDFPDFSFTDLGGKKRRFSEFRGKFVLLDFWGTWCAPCVAEIPNLKEAYEKYHERGFEIIGMNSEDPVERLSSFVAKREMGWPQATSESIAGFLKDLGVPGYPTYVLISPGGQIVSVGDRVKTVLLDRLEKNLPIKRANGQLGTSSQKSTR